MIYLLKDFGLRTGTVSRENHSRKETVMGATRFSLAIVAGAVLFGMAGCSGTVSAQQQKSAFHDRACASYPSRSNPWHISNLYDCSTRTLYVPYHLWTGAEWDGSQTPAASCMHAAATEFNVNGTSVTRINGPVQWTNQVTGTVESIWVRTKADGSKIQHFTCHGKGIGRVYDSRIGRAHRHWAPGRCKFPAGNGWQVGKRRSCNSTSIEITEIEIDEDGAMVHLTFKWWAGQNLDHIYRYVPNYGMANAWDQRGS